MRYVTLAEAAQIDRELLTIYGFTNEQILELSGLSCAQAIATFYGPDTMTNNGVLICCGPGNNGGNGLVCARHLKMFGYALQIYMPKARHTLLMEHLMRQCETMGLKIVKTIPSDVLKFDLIVDALFGFSFVPPVTPEFEGIMKFLMECTLPVVSIDIPSGWHMEDGEPKEGGIHPEMLISLYVPKTGSQHFKGKHVLAGRFVPPNLAKKLNLKLPPYEGISSFQLLLPDETEEDEEEGY